LLPILAAVSLQSASRGHYYQYHHEAVLTDQAAALTIQSPAGNLKRVALRAVVIYCTVPCVARPEYNGSPASFRAVAPPAPTLNPPTPTVRIFDASNVGRGRALTKVELKAHEVVSRDLSALVFEPAAAVAQNFTVFVDKIRGKVRLSLSWTEHD
jgi:hypothetical protein